MLRMWQFWTLTVVALLAAAFMVTNMVLFTGNRTTQVEVAGRQDYIQKSIQFEGLYRDMVRALADLAVRNHDQELKSLLAGQGITVTFPPAGPAPAAPRK